MTDTEILDYLQESVTYRRRRKGPEDVEIGSVKFTLGLRPKNLRELLVEAIEIDKGMRIREVTEELREMPTSVQTLGQFDAWVRGNRSR